MDYCKNVNLKYIGLHMEGAYRDTCYVCKNFVPKKVETKNKRRSLKIDFGADDRKIGFREETLLANTFWKHKKK